MSSNPLTNVEFLHTIYIISHLFFSKFIVLLSPKIVYDIYMKKALITLLSIGFITSYTFSAFAAPSVSDEYLQEAEERKSLPVQTNQIANWPAGPELGAESAYLLEANTGTVLYAKNINEKLYPASTTKLMTCLLAAENCQMDEMVSFSYNAVFSLESGSSTIGIDPGQSMPMRECLYGIMVGSANEVANAVAEHIAGSTEAFAEMMNKRAAELGCRNTHFVNPHGLFDENHYTTAHDLALIAKAFFQNEQLSKIGNTGSYHFEATSTQPDDFIVRNKHQLISGEISYEGIKGGKTGYTDEARQTLVTCAERNDMKLICVILKEESPNQFYDTVKLFDYGFTNFSVVNIAEHETKYSIESSSFFHTSTDILGNSKQILELNKDSYLIMPKTVTFEDLDSKVTYDTKNDSEIAVINYYYHDAFVGAAAIHLLEDKTSDYEFTHANQTTDSPAEFQKEPLIINVKCVLLIVLGLAGLIIISSFIHSFVVNYSFFDNMRRYHNSRKSRRKMKKGPHF